MSIGVDFTRKNLLGAGNCDGTNLMPQFLTRAIHFLLHFRLCGSENSLALLIRRTAGFINNAVGPGIRLINNFTGLPARAI